MNITAHHVVARERNVAAPRGPNAVWLPDPPKAPGQIGRFAALQQNHGNEHQANQDVQRHQDHVNLPADHRSEPRRPETRWPILLRLAFPAPASHDDYHLEFTA